MMRSVLLCNKNSFFHILIFSIVAIIIMLSPSLIISHENFVTTNDFQVNDDHGNNSQRSPSIDTDNAGNFIICWSDGRNASLDIYGQQFYWNGQPVGQNFLIYDDGGVSDQHSPAVAMDGEGNFVVIWNDFQGNKNHIYARLFNKNRDPLSSVFRVDDNGRPDNNIKSHALGRDKVSGNFLIAWCEETPNYFDYIYIQRYFNDGTPNGTNFLASGISTTTKDISIASDNNGNFYITYLWIDNTQLAIKVAKYNFNSTNSQFRIDVGDLSTYLDCPSVAAKSTGDFVITWEQHRSSQYGNWDIYAQRFNSNGSGIGSYFLVSEDLSDDQQGPDVSIDNAGNFIITWEDRRNGNWDIYAQQYESSGQAIRNNYRVNSDIEDSSQVNCDVSLKNGNIYTTWVDDRELESDPDIFANIVSWNQGATITVTSPNGGEVWQVDSIYSITWQSSNISGNVRIEFSGDNGSSWSVLTSNTDNDGSWDWMPQQQHISSTCLIEVGSVDNLLIKDLSDATFIIVPNLPTTTYHVKRIPVNMPSPTLDGILSESCWSLANEDSLLFGDSWGQSWTDYHNNLIRWRAVWSDQTNKLYVAVNVQDDIRGTFDNNNPNFNPYRPWYDDSIEFYTDGNNDGGDYDGRYDIAQQWRVSGENNRNLNNYPSSSHTDFYTGSDFLTAITTNPQNGNWTCEAEFTIYHNYPTSLKQLAIGSVIGWEIWYADSDDQTWTGWCYSYDHFTGWLFMGDASSNADYFGDMLLVGDLPNITVIAPNGGESWQIGMPQTIQWTSQDVPENVKIEISIDGGTNWYIITSSTTNAGSYIWTPTSTFVSDNCLIKISSTLNSTISDQSNSMFQVISSFSIQGRLEYYNNSMMAVNNATVQLSGFSIQSDISDFNGNYDFTNLFSGNYTVTPQKSNDLKNALTPFDASLILRYAVGLYSLTPYQMIAADVSGNGAVTSYDASWILRRYVGLVTTFPVGSDWTFVPDDFPINDMSWLTAPRSRSYTPLQSDQLNQDFFGILYGDVSGNWSGSSVNSTYSLVEIIIEEFQAMPDKKWKLPLLIKFSGNAFSGSLKLIHNNSNLELISYSIENGDFNNLLLTANSSEDEVKLAFASEQTLNNQKMRINLLFTGSKPLSSNVQIIDIVIDENPGCTSSVKKISEVEIPIEWHLGQNYPNPFNPTTAISYDIPEATEVRITIYDLQGDVVRSLLLGRQSAGHYQVEWDGRNDQGLRVVSGIYFYKLSTEKFSAVKKMILTK